MLSFDLFLPSNHKNLRMKRISSEINDTSPVMGFNVALRFFLFLMVLVGFLLAMASLS